jgi:hypothetical protein
MMEIRGEQLSRLDEDAYQRLITDWMMSEEPMFDGTWDRTELARTAARYADLVGIAGSVDRTRLYQLYLRYGPEFPNAETHIKHRMILVNSDFSQEYRLLQAELLTQTKG